MNDEPRQWAAAPVLALWAPLRRRWNRGVAVAGIVGYALAALVFLAFREDLRWAIAAFVLAQWLPFVLSEAVGVLLRRERHALRVLSWYAAEVETEADRHLDAGDAPGAALLVAAARPPAPGWETFQDQRLATRLAEAGAAIGGAPANPTATVAALDAGSARAANAALAVLAAQRLFARGGPWLEGLARANPDLTRVLARRNTRRRRVGLALLAGSSALALAAMAAWWPPPPIGLF